MSIRLFQSLLFKVSHLQQQIDREYKRPAPNWLRLLKLKKIRLAVKDRIHRLICSKSTAGMKFACSPARRTN